MLINDLVAIIFMVQIKICKLSLEMFNASFGAHSPPFDDDIETDHPFDNCRWRVKLMEECITKLDFATVDQMVQVHGICLSRHLTWFRS